jgi:ATP-binding cassette subfamily E protein 1
MRAADFYFFDEITPYLDIYQRVKVAKGIREILEEKTVVVVEHDLAILDMMADLVHIVYGEPGGYGVITQPKSTSRGINEYLEGYLRAENMRIRDKPIQFSTQPPREKRGGENVCIAYPGFIKRYAYAHDGKGFTLKAQPSRINKGEVLGIVGKNAIGKSTLVKILAGEIEAEVEEPKTSFSKVPISYKPQYIKIKEDVNDAKVKDLFYGVNSGASERNAIEVLEPLKIGDIGDKSIKQLGGGELQRVAIAACLCQDASLYMLDEPSAHLDVEQKVRLVKTIRRYAAKREVSMLIVDHDIYLVDLISDRLMVFSGEPGVKGETKGSFNMREGMNLFLRDLGITFRRDESSIRPRINKIGSAKDREQKEKGEYYHII